jgi:hypothetical protein
MSDYMIGNGTYLYITEFIKHVDIKIKEIKRFVIIR